MRPLALLLALAVAGCGDVVVGRGALAQDPLAAPGPAGGADAVDALIVGDRLLAAGEPEMALAAYTRGASRDGLTRDVRVALAAANVRLGRLGQAEALLRHVVEADPRDATATNDLAVILLRQGRAGEAHRLLRTAFALQPSPEIRGNLRVSAAQLAARTYDTPEDTAYRLTRRADGVYGLERPGSRP